MFYLFSKNDYATKKVQTENVKCVHFAIIAPAKVQEIKPVQKPKPKPKKKPKPKPKPIIKPKPIATPEPIVKQEEPIIEEIVEEELIEEEIVEEEIVEEELIEEELEQEIVQTDTISEAQQQMNQDIKEAKQREFIERLIKKINNNKSYPNMARRRCIEGIVDVKFKILSDGNVENIKIISGRGIFKKATTQAIERSFPIEVDSSLFDFPEIFKVKVAYTLK